MSTALPQTEHLALQLSAGVLRAVLNRPQQRNALAQQTVHELLATLEFANASDEVRALVLSGAGGHFCAGGDLKEMAMARGAAGADEADPLIAVSRRFGELCARYSTADVALIVVAEGSVMGGGFGLACVADLCIAHSSARFALPETRLGVLPAQIAPFLVERLGYGEARRLAVMGGAIDADEAFRIGLVNEVSDDTDGSLDKALASVLQCAPHALAVTKRLIRRARFNEAAALVDDAATDFAAAARGPEGVEGTLAFIEKRRPSWAPGD